MQDRLAPALALVLLVLPLGFAAPTWAAAAPEETENAAVLAAVGKLFTAIAERDAAALREVMVAEGPVVVLRQRDGEWAAARRTVDEFAAGLAAGGPALEERMWDAEVRLDGPLATVWAPYDFHVDGKLSHCGVDAFQLMKLDGVWRIASTLYTAYPAEGCPASPPGAAEPK